MTGLNVSMEVQGLDDLMRRMGDHKSVVDSELRKAESDGLNLIRDEAKRLAPGNKLPNSVQKDVQADGLVGRVGSVAKTVYSIEKGRPNSADGTNIWPSIEGIERWLSSRGQVIGARVSLVTHRRSRGRKTTEAQQQLHDDAARVVYAIRQQGGTKAQPFIVPAALNMKGQVRDRFSRAIGDALKRLVK